MIPLLSRSRTVHTYTKLLPRGSRTLILLSHGFPSVCLHILYSILTVQWASPRSPLLYSSWTLAATSRGRVFKTVLLLAEEGIDFNEKSFLPLPFRLCFDSRPSPFSVTIRREAVIHAISAYLSLLVLSQSTYLFRSCFLLSF